MNTLTEEELKKMWAALLNNKYPPEAFVVFPGPYYWCCLVRRLPALQINWAKDYESFCKRDIRDPSKSTIGCQPINYGATRIMFLVLTAYPKKGIKPALKKLVRLGIPAGDYIAKESFNFVAMEEDPMPEQNFPLDAMEMATAQLSNEQPLPWEGDHGLDNPLFFPSNASSYDEWHITKIKPNLAESMIDFGFKNIPLDHFSPNGSPGQYSPPINRPLLEPELWHAPLDEMEMQIEQDLPEGPNLPFNMEQILGLHHEESEDSSEQNGAVHIALYAQHDLFRTCNDKRKQ